MAALLPPDEPAYGFDNIGEMLDVSPALLERYSAAAAEIATLAVGDASDIVAGARVFRAAADHSQDQHNDGLPLGTSGGMAARTTLPLDGEYVIKVGAVQDQSRPDPRARVPAPAGDRGRRPAHLRRDASAAPRTSRACCRTRPRTPTRSRRACRYGCRSTAGPHDIGATFAGRAEVENTRRLQALLRTTSDTSETLIGPPHVLTITVTGPFNPTGPGDTPSRRAIFSCHPAAPAAGGTRAPAPSSRRLARRAYRGMQTAADVDELIGHFREWRRDNGFDSAIGFALQRILAGPKFLVRTERVPAARPGTVYRVSDVELASRLSFFLWSSIPDDELLDAGGAGPADARRRCSSSRCGGCWPIRRSEALVENFAGQWLQLRNLRSAVPDSREFPDFDDHLRQAFRRETELLFDSIVREDRSVLDLLTADYTFVNERLAQHYGIPHVYGSHFRRVTVTRRGPARHPRPRQHPDGDVARRPHVAGRARQVDPRQPARHAAAAAAAGRAAAAGARPALARPMTMRERMEQHRANPACASCHKAMDPLGLRARELRRRRRVARP